MQPACVSQWNDACIAAALVAADPQGVGGVCLRAAAGPIRDRWLDLLTRLRRSKSPIIKVPANVSDGRLLGGLDLTATLSAGRPIAERGLLSDANNGLLLLPMAERLTAAAAARITAVQDSGRVVLERDGFGCHSVSRFGIVALDEGIEAQEKPPAGLLDRLALHIDLTGIPVQVRDPPFCIEALASCRDRMGSIRVLDDVLVSLCETAAVLGILSLRAPWLALRAARAAAAIHGRSEVAREDIELAARLVFAPRATQFPADAPAQTSQAEPDASAEGDRDPVSECDAGSQCDRESERASDPSPESKQLTDRIVAAAAAALSPELLSVLRNKSAGLMSTHQGKRGFGDRWVVRGGRPAGTRAGEFRSGARLSVIETLRAAAPWQRVRNVLRGPGADSRICVRKEDFRILRFKRRSQQTTIFLVDASGSTALNRLAEAKGAVELMLADSYIHRDRVALISFRGSGAQLLLPPTNSLVRARRELASLPGGGGTPMALGLDTARTLADSLRRRGEAPMVVVLTDGRPNIARDGKGGRARAEADTLSAARSIRYNSIASLLVDTAPEPRILTEKFAREMGAQYLPLPYANAGELAVAVRRSGANLTASRRQLHA